MASSSHFTPSKANRKFDKNNSIQYSMFIIMLYVPASLVLADSNLDQGPRPAPVTAATTNSYVVKAVRFPIDTSGDCVFPSVTTLLLSLVSLYEYDTMSPCLVPQGGFDQRNVSVSEVFSSMVTLDGEAIGPA